MDRDLIYVEDEKASQEERGYSKATNLPGRSGPMSEKEK